MSNTALIPEVPAIAARKINNYIDCPNSVVESDPDPTDSFCSDDVKVRCSLSEAPYVGNYAKEPYVTVGCRPFNTRKESDVPDWCPLLVKR